MIEQISLFFKIQSAHSLFFRFVLVSRSRVQKIYVRFQDHVFWNLSHFRKKKLKKNEEKRECERERGGHRAITAHSRGYFLNREGFSPPLSSSHLIIYDVVYRHILEQSPKNNLANVKTVSRRVASHNLPTFEKLRDNA